MLAIIVAMDRNRLIGAADQLPWRLSADLRNFKRITLGKPIVMGRLTHESLARALPGRLNIVLTRDPGYRPFGDARVARTLREALVLAGDVAEVMVIGGADLYRQALPDCGRIYLTEVHAEFDGDTWFPDWDRSAWRETARIDHAAENGSPPYSFVTLEPRA